MKKNFGYTITKPYRYFLYHLFTKVNPNLKLSDVIDLRLKNKI